MFKISFLNRGRRVQKSSPGCKRSIAYTPISRGLIFDLIEQFQLRNRYVPMIRTAAPKLKASKITIYHADYADLSFVDGLHILFVSRPYCWRDPNVIVAGLIRVFLILVKSR